MNIWDFQQNLARRLLVWSALSIFFGLLLQLLKNPFSRGLGQQLAGWGVIDGLIATIGLRGARKEHLSSQNAVNDLAVANRAVRQQDTLQRILEINTGLDILYMAGGLQTVRTKGSKDAFWRGTGLGIIIQGGFLFFFDLFHAVLLRRRHVQ